MRRLSPLLTAALLALALAGCGGSARDDDASQITDPASATPAVNPTAGGTPASPAPSETAPASQPASESADLESTLKAAAKDVADSLRDRDLKSIASWIDPDRGLRFSPYSRIDVDKDLVFKAAELPSFKDATTYEWGSADGSGDPIRLTFRDYFEKYVYDQDFADAPNVSAGKLLGTGNAPSNILEVYPQASFVEYHFPGTDKNSGMDWKSLVIVFMPSGSDWKLVSIVHGQWTI